MLKKLFGGIPNACATFAWCFVLYLLFVILFGAWVRITGSGAGCGSHWPTCQGELIPTSLDVKKTIEFTHRLTSGMCGILGLILLGWTYKKFGATRVFFGAVITFIFILIEALVGAGIVLKELVANDSSMARAIIISVHLVNTLILMGSASLTAWWAGGHHGLEWDSKPLIKWLIPTLLGAIIATSMSGAITALGDTLFPVQHVPNTSLFAHVTPDLDATKHFLIRLRIVHPILATITAALLWFAAHFIINHKHTSPGAQAWAYILITSTCIQVTLGVINIALAAPGWLQLLHLLVAQSVWIAATLMSASLLERDTTL